MNYLKKSLLFVLLFISTGAFSQLEAKFDALGTVLGMTAVKAEYLLNENIGAELSFNLRFGKPFLTHSEETYKQFGGGVKLESRYYFSPDYIADGFYLGLYIRSQSFSYYSKEEVNDEAQEIIKTQEFTSYGPVLGFKFFFDSRITLDGGIGVGKYLSYSYVSSLDGQNIKGDGVFDLFTTFGIGYRFDLGEEKMDADFEEF